MHRFLSTSGLCGYIIIGLLVNRPPVFAQSLPAFTWVITNQDGDPLGSAVVWINLNGNYIATCTTDASGRCSKTISCAPPCHLDGRVEWQGHEGSYGGVFPDGAIIPVTIILPSPSPSPSPEASPSPSSPPGPTPSPPLQPTLTCTPEVSGDQDSRPVRCDACNLTDKMTASCAESFTVHDKVEYKRGDVDFWCPDPGGKPWVEGKWGGIVTVDPSITTIPFVGKKGQESERKYLADYFEGTGIYYKPPYDFSEPEEIKRVMAEGGIFRKLASRDVQDKLKKELIKRAIKSKAGTIFGEGAIHDYKVEYDGESAQLSEFAGHYPPEELEERKKWEENTTWGRLWKAVPMFSREDTRGYIYPYLGARPEDKFEILNPEAQIEKVPHLARLYEVGKAINSLLLPEEKIEGDVLGEKTLLAQNFGEWDQCAWDAEANRWSTDACATMSIRSICCSQGNGVIIIDAKGYGHAWVSVNGGPAPGSQALGSNMTYFFGCPTTPGATVNVSVTVTNHNIPLPGGHYSVSGGCGMTIDEKGNACCAGGQPFPPAPTCGLPDPLPVNSCQKEAITDTNPNDDLCCSPIGIKLSATDQFINEDYIECGVQVSCDRPGVPCHDACDQRRIELVQREVGINLAHPYLYEIWNYSSDSLKGFFNIFRPKTKEEFEPLDAYSTISYGYIPGSAVPAQGKFYFPYLGGVQKAKEWVLKQLNP